MNIKQGTHSSGHNISKSGGIFLNAPSNPTPPSSSSKALPENEKGSTVKELVTEAIKESIKEPIKSHSNEIRKTLNGHISSEMNRNSRKDAINRSISYSGELYLRQITSADVTPFIGTDFWLKRYVIIRTGSLYFFENEKDIFDEDKDPTSEIFLANVLVVESSSDDYKDDPSNPADSVSDSPHGLDDLNLSIADKSLKSDKNDNKNNQSNGEDSFNSGNSSIESRMLGIQSMFDIHARVSVGGNANGIKVFSLRSDSPANAKEWMEQVCNAIGFLELLPAEGGGYVSLISKTAINHRDQQRMARQIAMRKGGSNLIQSGGTADTAPILSVSDDIVLEHRPEERSLMENFGSVNVSGIHVIVAGVSTGRGGGRGRGRGRGFIGGGSAIRLQNSSDIPSCPSSNLTSTRSSPTIALGKGRARIPEKGSPILESEYVSQESSTVDEAYSSKTDDSSTPPSGIPETSSDSEYDSERSVSRAMNVSKPVKISTLLAGRGQGRGKIWTGRGL